MYPIRLPRASQPQDITPASTDWQIDHLWAANVVGRMRLYDSGVKATHGTFGTATSGSEPSGVRWNLGPDGWYMTLDDTGTGSVSSTEITVGNSAGSGGPSSTTWWMFFRFMFGTASPGIPQTLLGSITNGIQVRIDGNSKVALNKAGAADIYIGTQTIAVNTVYDVGLTYDGTNVSCWIDGVLDGTASNAQTFTAGQFKFGVSNGAERIKSGARIYRWAIGRGYMTDAMANALRRDGFWQLYEPRTIWVPVTVDAGATGTLATTNADDTSSASGTTTVLGTLAKTNANDTSSASGSVGSAVSGTSATTNANDTAAAAGTTTVVGALARTNANDTAAASGIAGIVSGTADVTNADDTSAASGTSGTSLPRMQGAGKPKRQKRVIEIDGRDVVVGSTEEAQAILDGLKQDAQQKAAIAIQRAANAPNRKPRKVLADARRFLQVPSIDAPGLESEAAQALRDIEAIYKSAMVTVEVAALLAKRQREEEDDEDVLLLIA